jgi:thiosulfate dehydrogenase [quinone] large subunit
MNKAQRSLIVALRVALGGVFLYAGITKILDPGWSAAGYIGGAKTFPALYQIFLSPEVLPIVNILNSWGLTLLGISLIVGILVRYSSLLGAVLMLLYFLPELDFPYVGEHSFLIDEHIIYALLLILFSSVNAGKYWGLDRKIFYKR